MPAFERISGPVVVALDGSPLAEQALPYAAAVARRRGAPLHLVTVHEAAASSSGDGFDASYDPAWYATTEAGQKKYVEGVAERLAGSGISVVAAVEDGPIAASLLEHVGRAQASLLVMASHGRGGLNRAWLGSTLDRLIREVSIPLLVVRASAGTDDAEPAPRRIVITLDGSVLAQQVMEPALWLGRLFDCDYELLQVVSTPYAIGSPHMAHSIRVDQDELDRRVRAAEAHLANVRTRLEREQAVKVSTRVVQARGTPVVDALLAAAVEDGADLIALATHGRGGVRRLILGSVADKLIRAATLPLLVVRPESTEGTN